MLYTFTNLTALRKKPFKDKIQLSFFLSSPKGKINQEAVKNTSFLYIFTSTDKTNYQCICVQTEGFFLILDEKFILTPTVPADASNSEINGRKLENS